MPLTAASCSSAGGNAPTGTPRRMASMGSCRRHTRMSTSRFAAASASGLAADSAAPREGGPLLLVWGREAEGGDTPASARLCCASLRTSERTPSASEIATSCVHVRVMQQVAATSTGCTVGTTCQHACIAQTKQQLVPFIGRIRPSGSAIAASHPHLERCNALGVWP
jgi:hypothetical protein